MGETAAACAIASMYRGRGAELYDEIARTDSSELIETIHAVRGGSRRVLELAAGAGRITLALVPFVREIVAVDLSPELLSLLSERVAELPPHLTGRVRCVEADIRRFRPEGRFDAVVLGTTSISLFDPDERAALCRDIRGWLADDGIVVMSLRSAPETGRREHVLRPGLVLTERTLSEGGLVAGLRVAGDQTPYEVRTYAVSPDELIADAQSAGLRLRSATPVGGGRHDPRIGTYDMFIFVPEAA